MPLSQLEIWNDYILVFEKVGSDDGEEVVVRGFERKLITDWAESSRERGPLTIDDLRGFEMSDGGCLLWSVLYDVRRGTFRMQRPHGP